MQNEHTTLYWVGGWASDLQAWDQELARLYPQFHHRYLDAHNLLDGRRRMEQLLANAPEGTCLAGWSLGSLLVEHLVLDGAVPTGMPILHICPFLDFCHPMGPWRPQVVRRMLKRLFGDSAGVLADFGQLAEIPQEFQTSWLRQAILLGEERLAQGLSALTDLRIGELYSPWEKRLFAVVPNDPVSPPTTTPLEQTRPLPEGSGHAPFLSSPIAFGAILEELIQL